MVTQIGILMDGIPNTIDCIILSGYIKKARDHQVMVVQYILTGPLIQKSQDSQVPRLMP